MIRREKKTCIERREGNEILGRGEERGERVSLGRF